MCYEFIAYVCIAYVCSGVNVIYFVILARLFAVNGRPLHDPRFIQNFSKCQNLTRGKSVTKYHHKTMMLMFRPISKDIMVHQTGLRGSGALIHHQKSRLLSLVAITSTRTPAKTSIRYLHSSNRLLAEEDERQKKLDDEIRKLKELREKFKQSNFIGKFRIQSQLIEQEAKVSNAQLYQSSILKTPEIKFHDNKSDTVLDPLDPDYSQYLVDVYRFNLTCFIRECDKYKNRNITNPNILLNDLIQEFDETFPEYEPLAKEEFLFYFHIYHDLANNLTYFEDLKFDHTTIIRLMSEYEKLNALDLDIEMENTPSGVKRTVDDSSADIIEYKNKIDQLATEMDIETATIYNWFEIFQTLQSTPMTGGDGNFMTCTICPNEYAKFQNITENLNNIEDKLSSFYGNLFKNGGSNGKGKTDGKNTNSGDKNSGKKPYQVEFNVTPTNLFQFGAIAGLLIFLSLSLYQDNYEEITFQKFTTDFLEKNFVQRLVVSNNRTVNIELNDNGSQHYGGRFFYFNIGSIEVFEKNLKSVQDKYNIDDAMRIPVIYVTEGSMGKLMVNFLPTLLFLGAIYYMTRRAANMGGMGGPLGFGKSTAKKFNQETDVKIRFKDVAGMAEAKEEVMEFVKFLQNPRKYEKLGAKIPRGAILSGSPGTGKTLIAKATAGEANVPFFSVSGSEFVEMFVGVGASRVRDLFKTARENAPSIVFVDEIDAIGKSRSKGNATGSNDERETTLNQLLVEMDGFESSDHVVVLAGTNRVDILDKALMRPGRFDRHITIDNPELKDRKEIFDVHLQKIKLSENIDHDLSGRLATLTPGFSGADIANVCNESALIAARYNQQSVNLRHFELAIERVIGGIEKKTKVLSPEERKIVAYHEAGHAICGWFLRYAHPLLKVSIVPRGSGTLGYAQYLPPDQYLLSTKQLIDRMIMTLGGRVSEEIFFKSVTGGAHDDFKKVTQMAQSMVLRFGMSKKIGMINYADTRSQDNLTKPFSDETNRLVDEEIHRIVGECYSKCRELLTTKKHEVEQVADELLKKEFITRQDMISLLGKRPFPETNDAFDKYLDSKPPFQAEPESTPKDEELKDEEPKEPKEPKEEPEDPKEKDQK